MIDENHNLGPQKSFNRIITWEQGDFELRPADNQEFMVELDSSTEALLMDSLAIFECERHAVHEGGDHDLLVGQVLRASFDPNMDPLLYFRGKYRRLHFD